MNKEVPCESNTGNPQLIASPSVIQYLGLYVPFEEKSCIRTQKPNYSMALKFSRTTKKLSYKDAYQFCDIFHNDVLHECHTFRKWLIVQAQKFKLIAVIIYIQKIKEKNNHK